MKLFLKDHLSVILLYTLTFILIPILINSLDGINNHIPYFIVLSIFSLMCLLVLRYARRRKFYKVLSENESLEEINVYDPQAMVEKVFSKQMKRFQSTLQDEKYQANVRSTEQQLLISHVVHQMKTPLSVVQLLVQTNQTNYSNDFVEWEKVKRESNKMNYLLNQLLTYNRAMEFINDFKVEKIELRALVQEVINDLKDYFIELSVFPKNQVPEHTIIYSDRKWLKVVIYQIVNNAVKYGDEETTVTIEWRNNRLSIHNIGRGIAPNEIHRVFDLYYTGAVGREGSEATGIGLYLVKMICDALDHSIHVESKDKHVTFTIEFTQMN